MATNVITINRQFGSMGRPIAKLVAEKLGYEYYDRDIIDNALSKVDIPVDKYLQIREKPLSKYDMMMYPLGIGDAVKQDKIFQAEKNEIIELASAQNCVVVGRCSDYILKTCQKDINVFSVFVYAPVKKRKEFCEKKLGILPENINDYIIKVDRGRNDFYKRQTGEEFTSMHYRNLMIDSSTASMDHIADIICKLAMYSFEHDE